MTINISFHENNSGNTIVSAFKTEPFHVDLLCLLFLITIFAEDRRHSAMSKQAFIALVCTIFAEDRRHSAMSKQAFIALVCTIFAEDRRHSAMTKQAFIALVCTIIIKSNSP